MAQPPDQREVLAAADGCCRRVAELCATAERRLGPGIARDEIIRVREDLSEPLRVAVAGRVKSGKSTLVNALLRHDVAPTAYGECTKAVTWFRFGFPPEARLVFRTGDYRQLPLEPGQRLPADLAGGDVDDLDRVDVQLSSDALEEVVVIDTPGLQSANDQFSAATRRALALGVGERQRHEEDADDLSLRTEVAASHADALVYLITGPAQSDEVEALESFRSHLGGLRASAVNTIAVLNKADLIEDASETVDPVERGRELAERYSERLGALSAGVIPTNALLAETVEAGKLTESDVAQLSRIAALPSESRERMTDNVKWFLETKCDVEPDARRRLLDLLGIYGVRRCLGWIDGGIADVGGLRSRLSDISGIDELRTMLGDLFARRADVLKAANSLARIERILAAPTLSDDERSWLGSEVERTRLAPEMQALATTWAFAQAAAHELDIPEELHDDLRRVALGGSVPEKLGAAGDADSESLKHLAAERSTAWRMFINSGVRIDERRIANVMCQQHAALWRIAEQGAAARG